MLSTKCNISAHDKSNSADVQSMRTYGMVL